MLFALLSIAETVLMFLFKPISVWLILIEPFVALLCIVEIRFAYHLVLWGNMRHSLRNRKNPNEEYDEPSDYAVGWTKAAGYIGLLLSQIVLFF